MYNLDVKYIIDGPCVATGEIFVSGAKNFSIKAFALALLQNGNLEYHNVPNNLDVVKTNAMLESLGAKIDYDIEKKYSKINASNVTGVLEDNTHANMITLLMAAALVHRCDYVKLPKHKGCEIGNRASDFHINAFEKFGIEYIENDAHYIFKKNKDLIGCVINLPFSSVGATETALFLAVKATGTTRICNAAIEPEVQALITAMQIMGAKIFFAGDREIIVEGVEHLQSHSSVYIHGDYLEAATWAVMAAVTNGEIIVRGVVPELIGSFLGFFNIMGGRSERIDSKSIKFSKNPEFKVTEKEILLEADVYPVLRTDLQPILAAIAAVSQLKVKIHDKVYNDRVRYVDVFKKFGVNALSSHQCFGSTCKFHNTKSMHSCIIEGNNGDLYPQIEPIKPDSIRGGMADIILACAAKGITIIEQVEIIERGYCSLFEKLFSIGVNIKRVENHIQLI